MIRSLGRQEAPQAQGCGHCGAVMADMPLQWRSWTVPVKFYKGGSVCCNFRGITPLTLEEEILQPQNQGTKMSERDHSDYPDLSRVPSCYHDLREVFNKTSLLSHWPWDCAVYLLPGAPIPKASVLYAISGPQRKTMDVYIEASLKSGIIHPSSSPAMHRLQRT
ncbi:hypothetical protein L3Q82_001353 [Scortum barcoo]|uniref:Uncharacterized protein n=1 Tax=Scortum barcoo TaxID=214431 RepID=A0ACB8W7A2_9TELE|nr:hypothetical protein L3Q82_001353 [Scortum barcoo]